MTYAWAQHKDDELWNSLCTTKEEVIVEAVRSLGEDAVFYVGKCETVPLTENIDSDHILEYLDSQYSDESGCDYYIYDGVEEEHTEWLVYKQEEINKEILDQIMNKNEGK